MTAYDISQLPAVASDGESIRLPAIRVRIEPSEIAAFSAATKATGNPDFVPLTFPCRWLALPDVRMLILRMIGGDGYLPVHEAQSFSYEKRLEANTPYILTVTAESKNQPRRIVLQMKVSTENGSICARLETILRSVRLFPESRA